MQQMQPMMAAYYPSNVTTDHIQQYLDENKSLILKIVESQNSGKVSECAENQARLQRNLMYLAAIADSQPQPLGMHSQYPAGEISQPGAHYMHHQQPQQMTSQSIVAARASMYGQQQFPAHQEVLHSQLGISSGGSSGITMLQGRGFPDFGCGNTVTSGSAEQQGGSSGGHGGDGRENL
ncbi:GRF1-interacting factor 1-like [Olea europaea subsp. europaea]|uniref:GRF1-interacting factor 1-like n=1 Tax=Olea europaea subsp. europaea TaxID=158383 RepID=A0A8S0QZH3_OLEEU|nr:GRF1-interacting factor 1-like [Olea europaea subsp. europaea]